MSLIEYYKFNAFIAMCLIYFTELELKEYDTDFYTKWQSSVLADAGNYVSKEYNNFQTALLSEISKYAKAVDAAVVAESKGHYLTSCFIERNGKFVYISHSSDARMDGGVKIELDSFSIRTAWHVKDYTGGINQYCDMSQLQSMIDKLLS